MALDDRDYYREELARKRGIRSGGWRRLPSSPAPKPLTPTPVLDVIVANATSQEPGVTPARASAAEDDATLPARVVGVADWPAAPSVPAVWRRRWRQRVRCWRGRLALAFLAIAIATLPPLVTPRCSGLVTWRNSPMECWQFSAAVLVKRIVASMAATRSDRVM
jgi:hypothetical protein